MNPAAQMAKDLYRILSSSNDKQPKPYDSTAEVVMVEDNVVWVRIPGSSDVTPIRKTINAKEGDSVQIRVANGDAWMVGNISAPPTDDMEAIAAKVKAFEADIKAQKAQDTANDAITVADRAEADARRAKNAADDAEDHAQTALTNAGIAKTAADNALSSLGVVESVVDTVNWFAEHKTLSTDTTVDATKTYYIYDPTTGSLSQADPVGTENPSQEGWYELSDAISSYVATHVATTDDGLFVLSLSNGWKLLVSSGGGNYTPGVFIIDPNGDISQATTANGISFNDDKPFYIGDNNASIIFDGNGHITITGSGVEIGSQSLDSVLTQLGASLKSVEYGKGSSSTDHSDITTWSSSTPTWEEGKYIWMRTTTNGLTYTYTCIQGAKGDDGDPGESAVILRIDSSRGTVFKNSEISTVLTAVIYYKNLRITDLATLRANYNFTAYLQWYWQGFNESTWHTLASSDSRLSNDGFTLTLTPQDVNTKIVFQCNLMTN